jgi:hypothetical protein
MKRLIALTGIIVMFGFSAVPVFAAVPAHLHELTLPNGDIQSVGPDACGVSQDSGLYDGWLNFHENVHTGVPGTQAFDNPSNPVDIIFIHCPAV